MANYEALLDLLKNSPPGAVLEIGAFCGEGTAKLLGTGRRVIVCDTFDAVKDPQLGGMYAEWLRGRNQAVAFRENTDGYPNLKVFTDDSLLLVVDQPLALSFIDGAHDYQHVRSDFATAWEKTVPGGWVCLHDYQHDLPEVTRAIEDILTELGPDVHCQVIKGDVTICIQKER